MSAAGRLAAVLMFLAAGPATAAWPVVPLPEDSQGEWVSRDMNYNGINMRASRFVTTGQVEDIKAYYQDLWRGESVVNDIAGKTVIGHAEGNHFITVELKPLGGGTEGIIGVMEMFEGEMEFTLGEGFATPGGSQVYNDIRYYDGPRESRTVALQNNHSPFVNHQFYYHQLRMQGWHISSDPTQCRSYSNSCVAGFEKNRKTLNLVISRVPEQGTHVVLITE